MYFEGCRWDYNNQCITEQHSKQLFSKVPIIWLQPKETRPNSPDTLRTKVSIKDNASVSTRRQAITDAASQSRYHNGRRLRTETKTNESNNGNKSVQNEDGQPIVTGGASLVGRAQNAAAANNYYVRGAGGKARAPGATGPASNNGTVTNENAHMFENEAENRQETHYECPLYRTSARYGALKTNGHSTNFIIMVSTPLPPDAGENESRSVTTMGGQRMIG